MKLDSRCPDDVLLEQFLSGRSTDEEADPIAEHLLTCDKCTLVIDRLMSGDKLFRAMGQALPAVAGEQDDPAVRGLIERLGRLGPRGSSIASGASPFPDTDTGVETPLPTPGKSDDESESRPLFAPPQDPGELGRLAHYRILRLLGRGGMGMVYEAEDAQLQRRVAIKLMKPALARDPLARQRFLREARAAAAIKHDHIVTIHQVGEEGGIPFLVMELLDGESLESWLAGHPRPPILEIVRMAREMADGLAAAHERGLIHRDVKPDNLWIEPNGRVKLLDFGLARSIGAATLQSEAGEQGIDESEGRNRGFAAMTQAGTIAGTPAYMSPEQASGATVDSRGDLFSLGCVLYRLCAEQAPFQGRSSSDLIEAVLTQTPPPLAESVPDLPRALSDLVFNLLAKRPAERPQSAQAVLETVQAIGRDLENVQEKEARQRSRRRVLALVALCVLATGTGVWALVHHFQAQENSNVVEFDEEGWRRDVGALPAPQQLEAVRRRLRELNPGFDGQFSHGLEDGQVIELQCNSPEVIDLRPLKALPKLRRLNLAGTAARPGRLTDLSPLHGLPLVYFSCTWTPVSDLAPLQDMQLTELQVSYTQVRDLSPLRGQRLEDLGCRGTAVADLTPLEGQPLKEIWFDYRRERDLEGLHGFSALVHINGIEAADFWRQENEYLAARDAFAKSLAQLAPDAQVKAVAARLRELNPGFDGKVKHQAEGSKVTRLAFNTNQITDLTPVAALTGLEWLTCKGSPQRQGRLDNLWPLRGLALTRLDCGDNKAIDLEPLRGMPLRWLRLSASDINDLSPLSAAPLEHLECAYTGIRDLKPLQACPLNFLAFHGTKVTDLMVLQGMRLEYLSCKQTIVSDFSPIQDLPLKELVCDILPQRDLKLLRSIKTLEKLNGKPVAQALAEIEQGMKKSD